MIRGPFFLPATEAVASVAVCAGRTPNGNTHAGVLYRDTRDHKVKLLDLYLDGSVHVCNAVDATIALAWAVPDLDVLDLADIAAFCQTVADGKPRLQYFFKAVADTKLIYNGIDFTLENAQGLTCSTFVIAIFQGLDHPLMMLDSWPYRPEDARKQAGLLGILRSILSGKELQNRADELPCKRYRPEEVAGACLVGSHPTHFDQAAPAGVSFLEWLDLQEAGNHSAGP